MMKSAAVGTTMCLVLVVVACSGIACSKYSDMSVGEREVGDVGPRWDSGGEDTVSIEDALPALDAASESAMEDTAVSDARDAPAVDATDGDWSSSDAVDAATDGHVIDVTMDSALADTSSSDAPADPTAPRFRRTGKYTIVIPPLGDAGTGARDASTSDAGAGDPADVYYPDPPDLRTGGYAFPIVLLLQGAKVGRVFYGGVAAGVAGYGFIVVVPDHTSNNIGGPGLYAELSELAAAGAQMKVEATSATAPVRGVVDTQRMALMGHSYGGASGLSGIANMCFPPIPLCTFQRPPELVAGAFYGTNLATPVLGVPALDNGALPVLLVQGDRDGKALPADGFKTYDQIQKRPKAILTLLGANHYGMTDVDNPPGADPEVNAQPLNHTEGVASSARWIGVFLAAFVHRDAAARGALRSAGALDKYVAITLAE